MTEEDQIQMNIVHTVRLAYPKSKIFSIPNGGFRFKTTAMILKATGLLKGASDLIFVHKGKVIFVEVKTEKGTQTKEQIEFMTFIKAAGLQYWIVRSAFEMLERIKQYDYQGW